MKSSRIIPAVAGILLFLSIVLTTVWFLSPAKSNQPTEISVVNVVSKVEKREVKEINFRQSQVEITDNDGKKFFTSVGSDATREVLLGTVKEYNKTNTSAPIKYSEEPASSGWGWVVLATYFPFYFMWGLTLAVIVYAVKTLSRNKG